MRDEPRGNWYLLTGLIMGLVAGLAISLYFYPARYSNSEPAALSEEYRSEYRRLIAEAYQADGNLPRAQARLALLRDNDPVQSLAAQAQRVLAEGGSPDDARPLAALAQVLSGGAPVLASPSPTPPAQATPAAESATPSPSETPASDANPEAETATPDGNQGVFTPTPEIPTQTPTPTFPPLPSATPKPVLAAPFSLAHQSEICDTSLPPGLIVVEVRDQSGVPMPGVRIQVAWDGGQDTFFTGLAPEISPGYADFRMTQGISYTLRVGEAGAPVSGITIPACGGSRKFEFQAGGR